MTSSYVERTASPSDEPHASAKSCSRLHDMPWFAPTGRISAAAPASIHVRQRLSSGLRSYVTTLSLLPNVETMSPSTNTRRVAPEWHVPLHTTGPLSETLRHSAALSRGISPFGSWPTFA